MARVTVAKLTASASTELAMAAPMETAAADGAGDGAGGGGDPFGCDGSTPVPAPPCRQWNPAGGPLTNQTESDEVVLRIGFSGQQLIESFELYTASVSGAPVTVAARLYTGNVPNPNPVAVTTMTVGGTPGFYKATFATPVSIANACYIGIETSALDVYLPELQFGQFNVAYARPNSSSPWTVQVLRPAYLVNCQPDYLEPAMGNTGRPVLGASFDVDLADALPSTFAKPINLDGPNATVSRPNKNGLMGSMGHAEKQAELDSLTRSSNLPLYGGN